MFRVKVSCITSVDGIKLWLLIWLVNVAHNPIITLRRLLTNVKGKDKPEDRRGAVYKIKCCNCQLLTLVAIGETGRNLIKPATDRTQTSDEEWWRQQSHCWTPFTDETSNWLGLCDMYYVFYRLQVHGFGLSMDAFLKSVKKVLKIASQESGFGVS